MRETASESSDGLIACETCGLVQQLPAGARMVRCQRCKAVLKREHPNSRARTMAFALAALVLYLPANIYPVLTLQSVGKLNETTVWSGVVSLYQDGMWFVATIVFTASILIPVIKLLGLFFLASNASRRWPRESTWIYKWICVLGPWAMLDVFLLAIAVAIVKFGSFGTIIPGRGISAFAAVVMLTLLASSSFDPRSIWKGTHEKAS